MMQQNLPIIATITTLGTLMGLLGTVTVSYTHLDVYKRQGLDTMVVNTVNDEYSLFAIYSKRPSESIKYSTWGVRRQR